MDVEALVLQFVNTMRYAEAIYELEYSMSRFRSETQQEKSASFKKRFFNRNSLNNLELHHAAHAAHAAPHVGGSTRSVFVLRNIGHKCLRSK